MIELLNSNYSKNILTLISGNSLAQAIPIIISPILTRIYTPSDFGVLALFASLSVLLSSISSAQYESAIMLPKQEKNAYILGSLAIILSIIFSIFLFLIIINFHDRILILLNNDEISTWLYFIPLVIILTTLFNVLTYLNLKSKNFKSISTVKVYKSLAIAIVQVSLGLIKNGSIGLIVGQILSHFVGIIYLYKKISLFKYRFEIKRSFFLIKKYKKFPIYYLPNNLIYNSLNTLNNILISTFFSISSLGLYSFTNRILGIPSAVIGSAVSQAYLEKTSNEIRNNISISNTFIITLKKLLLISLPIFTFCFFTLEILFGFIFGEEWGEAGYYAQILSPFFFVRFISAGLNTTTVVLEKQQLELYYNMLILSCLILTYVISNFLMFSFEEFLILMTCIMTLVYSLKIYYYYYLIKERFKGQK